MNRAEARKRVMEMAAEYADSVIDLHHPTMGFAMETVEVDTLVTDFAAWATDCWLGDQPDAKSVSRAERSQRMTEYLSAKHVLDVQALVRANEPSSLESSADAAGEWAVDAAMAERAAREKQ